MKKGFALLLVMLLSLSLLGCSPAQNSPPAQNNQAPTAEQEQEQVRSAVTAFGQKLQMVSLTAPPEQARQQMQENYGELVTPELLAQWQNQPDSAPGRKVSSPWPDRIEIMSVEKTDGKYAVKGEIIEITSVEKTSGGAAARQSIDLTLTKSGDRWLIDSVVLGTGYQDGTILYQNTQYGFDFVLPVSWQGYTIVNEEWEGTAITGPSQGKVVSQGPGYYSPPQWTQAQPHRTYPSWYLPWISGIPYKRRSSASELLQWDPRNWTATPNMYLPCRPATILLSRPASKRWKTSWLEIPCNRNSAGLSPLP